MKLENLLLKKGNKVMGKGIIYVMSTAVEGLIKIGITDNFERRMGQLESNGYRNVAGLKRQFAIEVENYEEKEILLDDMFEKSRLGTTELFSLDLNKTIQLLSCFEGKQIYPLGEMKEEVFERVTEAVQNSEIPDGTYVYEVKNQLDGKLYKGTMLVEKGKLTLKVGSTLAPLTVDGTNVWITTRKSMGVDACVLNKDLVCSSVSIAANYVCGHEKNGWKAWKDPNGNFIDIYRK